MSLITALGIASALFVAWFTYRQFYGHDDGRGAQSRRESIIEAWTNIVIGFSINYAANLLFLPLVGAKVSASGFFWLGWLYTAVSILRQYAVRRWFNANGFARAVAGVLVLRRATTQAAATACVQPTVSDAERHPLADEEMA